MANILFDGYIKVFLSVYQIFHFFAITNSAAMNICFHVFSSLGYLPTNKIAESYSNSMFDFLKKYQTTFQSRNAPFYILSSCVYRFSFLSILVNIYFLSFFIIALIKWYVTVVLIHISLMTGAVEGLSTCSLTNVKNSKNTLPIFYDPIS